MTNVETLEANVAAAKAAYKANKKDKSLKEAVKVAKQALSDGQAAAEEKAAKKAAKKGKKRKAEGESPASKKPKIVDVEALKAEMKAAKKAHKADKTNADLKAAFDAAKAAHKAATENAENGSTAEELAQEEEKPAAEEPAMEDTTSDDAPANPTQTCKLFLGNLSFDIDDDTVREFFSDCGELNDIFWLSDRESGRFKGCGFVTFNTPTEAAKGFAKNGQELMGREIKADYAQAKPQRDGGKDGGKGFKKGGQKRELSEKPDNCVSCFCGNLSYEIDDDSMKDFAKDCGEIKAIRWLTDRESGDFKGCGFVEFYDTESVDNFVKKNGEDCKGRSIRIDYAASRSK